MADERCLGDFACAYNGKIYIISSTKDLTGYGGGNLNPTLRVDEYNPATGASVQKANILTARCYKEADAIGDRIYVVSGVGTTLNDYKDENEYFDVLDNTWHTHTPLPYAARGVAQCVYNGKIYLCGGNVQASNDFLYVFDPNIPATFSGTKNVVDVMDNNDGTAQRDVEILTVEDAGDVGLIFDPAETDYLNCGNDSSLDMPNFVAISAFFKTSSTTRMSIVDKGFNDYEIAIEDNKVHTWWGNSAGVKGGSVTLPATIADGAKHHIIVQLYKSVGEFKVWLDGNYINIYSEAASTGNQSRWLCIGSREAAGQLFDGTLYNVIIFNTELTNNEIAWLWNGGNGRENLSLARPLVGGSLAKGRRGLV